MGVLSDIFGRRKIILVSAVIFAVGALWSGLATDLTSLVFSRLFLGIAIGVASFTVPLYIAEIAPAKSRGRLVSMFQLMVTIGILLSYMSDTFWLMKTVGLLEMDVLGRCRTGFGITGRYVFCA